MEYAALLQELGLKDYNLPDDFKSTLYYLACKVNERHADMFMLYYLHGKKHAEIAEQYNLSKNASSLAVKNVLDYIKQPENMEILKMGLNAYHAQNTALAVHETEELAYHRACSDVIKTVEKIKDASVGKAKNIYVSVEEIGLSSRAENCLIRSGILTVADILKLGQKRLRKVRNLGIKSYEEIVQKLVNEFDEPISNWES